MTIRNLSTVLQWFWIYNTTQCLCNYLRLSFGTSLVIDMGIDYVLQQICSTYP